MFILITTLACTSGISSGTPVDDSGTYTGGPDDHDADGYKASEDDCDDNDDTVHPGAVEVCDGKDNDCNDEVDDNEPVDAAIWYTDADRDGYGTTDYVRVCESPGEGYATEGGDCDDQDPGINPGAKEVCDELWTDEDCNDLADDYDPDVDPSTQVSLHEDADGDGYGNPDVEELRCHTGKNWCVDGTDCDDTQAALTPENECDLGWFGTYTGDFVYNGYSDFVNDSCTATGVSIQVDPSANPQLTGSFTCDWAGLLAQLLGSQTVTFEGYLNSDDSVTGNFYVGEAYIDPWTGSITGAGVLDGTFSGATVLSGFDVTYDGTLHFVR